MNKPTCTYAIYKFYGVARIHFTTVSTGMARTGMMVARDLLHVTANENVGMGATGGWLFSSSRGRDYCGLCTTIRACDRNIGI